MPSTLNFVLYLCEQIREAGFITYRKMFGEYMVYCNGKPVLIVCDDTAYCKIIPETTLILSKAPQAAPYPGAKLHYIIEQIDQKEFMINLVLLLERTLPMPKIKMKK